MNISNHHIVHFRLRSVICLLYLIKTRKQMNKCEDKEWGDSVHQPLNIAISCNNVHMTAWGKDRLMGQQDGLESQGSEPLVHGNVYLTEMAFQTLGKAGLSLWGAETFSFLFGKDKIRFLLHHISKSKFQMDKDLNVKSRNLAFLENNMGDYLKCSYEQIY